MDCEHFPHAGASREFYWRDIYFANYHINHDKLNFLKYFDVSDAHRLIDDFNRYDSADWTITTTEAGSGSAAEALADLPCGWLAVITDNADNDLDELVTPSECWAFVSGYPCYFEIRGKIIDALNSDAWFGFINGDSLFGGVTYGAYFLKSDLDRTLMFVTEYNNVATVYDTGWDIEDLTCGRAAIHWDGAGNLRWFIFYDTDPPQQCLATGVCTVDIPTNVLFTAGFGIRNGDPESNGIYIDYLKVAMKRIPCYIWDEVSQRDAQ